MIERVQYNTQLYALILRAGFDKPGVNFITEDSSGQQVAYMNHPSGKIIPPHIHKVIKREVHLTQEVLMIKQGKLRVDFYNDSKEYIASRLLRINDIIVLLSGGHGFEVIEDLIMIEVKQGPYLGENDKIRFEYDPRQILKGN